MSHRPLGPGPGAYALPPTVGFPGHDPSRIRAPMYSMAGATPFPAPRRSPGPAYMVSLSPTAPAAPSWSLSARPPPPTPSRTPAPGAAASPPGPAAPAWSLPARPRPPAPPRVPAPNNYDVRCVPPAVNPPSYSMAGRSPCTEKVRSPGPARYAPTQMEIFQNRAAAYSLSARLDGPGKTSISPGPAAAPPNLFRHGKWPPVYSFGTHHSPWAPPMIVENDTMDCLD